MQEKQAMTFLNPFELLTEELIFIILDSLESDPESKKSFSLTCKAFHSIESHHRKSLKPLRIDHISRILHRYPHVERVDCTACPRIDDVVLVSLVDGYSKTLRSIDLSRSRFFTHVGLSRLVVRCEGLVELNLSNATELTDSGAAAIAEAKRLERLWMERCKLVSDIGIGCIAVGCKKLRILSLKWCVRITDLGVSLVANKCKELDFLDLSYLPITEKCLSPILRLEHLTGLTLAGCPGIDDESLAKLKEGCKSLEVLNISFCNIAENGLDTLLTGMECLRHLNLAYTLTVTSDLSKCFHKLSELQHLKLDGCRFSFVAMKAIANYCVCLKELSLCKCYGVTDEGLSHIVQKHVQLRMLDITCCLKLTHSAIESVTSSCTNLTSFRMEGCCMVPSEAFALIGQRCQYLEEIDVTDNEINDEGLEAISRCSNLLTLKLGLCVGITDDGLSHLGRGSQNLTNLDLYRCTGISDVGIEAIASSCPSIEMINMAYCDKLTDSSLISLSQCFKLRTLEIRGCSSVSSMGLSAISRGCKQLTILDIKKCSNVNDDAMVHLAQHSQYLKQINLSYCPVTDRGILALARISRLQNMTVLHVSGLSANGLGVAFLACKGLIKLKLHTFFKSSIPFAILRLMEERGCEFYWRNKTFG